MPAHSPLFKRGFVALQLTQFFGALNDNLLKGVLTFAVAGAGIWSGRLGEGGQGYVGLCLTLPFILLSGFAGQLADRTSKQRVTFFVKLAEIGIAVVALIGFAAGSLSLTLGALVLLAVQSTFFGPAKFGMIPELVNDQDLSQANGSINMFTNIAVIVGTLLAGPVYSLYYPDDASTPGVLTGEPREWVPGAALVLVALLGFAASLLLPRLKAMDPGLRIDWNPFHLYIDATRQMARTPLLAVAMAWAFFYLVGMMAILVLPEYRDLLAVSPTRTSVLLGILGVAIGLGSVGAGLISGKHIEPRIVPVGAAGMSVFFLLLGSMPLSFWLVAGLLVGAGFFAGLYIVPLQALLQHLTPADERGRFLGTANAMSFVASTTGSVVFLAARQLIHLPANRVFLLCGALSMVGTGVLLLAMRRVIVDPSLRRPDPTVPV